MYKTIPNNCFFFQNSQTGMAELEGRQDLLLKKLDLLYDRIVKISSICTIKNIVKTSNEGNTTKSKVRFLIILL